MPGMVKRARKNIEAASGGGGGEKRPLLQHPLRFDSPELLAALDACAEDRRQSRNAAILTILEGAMRQAGYLPRKTSQGPDE